MVRAAHPSRRSTPLRGRRCRWRFRSWKTTRIPFEAEALQIVGEWLGGEAKTLSCDRDPLLLDIQPRQRPQTLPIRPTRQSGPASRNRPSKRSMIQDVVDWILLVQISVLPVSIHVAPSKYNRRMLPGVQSIVAVRFRWSVSATLVFTSPHNTVIS